MPCVDTVHCRLPASVQPCSPLREPVYLLLIRFQQGPHLLHSLWCGAALEVCTVIKITTGDWRTGVAVATARHNIEQDPMFDTRAWGPYMCLSLLLEYILTFCGVSQQPSLLDRGLLM